MNHEMHWKISDKNEFTFLNPTSQQQEARKFDAKTTVESFVFVRKKEKSFSNTKRLTRHHHNEIIIDVDLQRNRLLCGLLREYFHHHHTGYNAHPTDGRPN